MKLTEHEPKWWNYMPVANGIKLGFSFRCPNNHKHVHVVPFLPIVNTTGLEVPQEFIEHLKNLMPRFHNRDGEDFETISFSPSIQTYKKDGTHCCHWTITKGVMSP